MNLEIERRFLVRLPLWSAVIPDRRDRIVQVYLTAEPERAVRVRVRGERAVLTVKGRATGAERPEVESDIDMDAAHAIIDTGLYAGSPIEKMRNTLVIDGLKWEVDEFEGDNAGLVIAEVEFHGEPADRASWERHIDNDRPDWADREITDDYRFANSRLALQPFADWPESERLDVLR